MYQKKASQILLPDDFVLPFGGKLNKENRWVKLAAIIPWWEFEDQYAACFKPSNKGEHAHSVRIALGTLIIQARLGLSDRETVQQIMENPYLQYFLGLQCFEDRKPPFDASVITYFRKRLTPEILMEINERIAKEAATAQSKKKKDDDAPGKGPGGSGGGSGEKPEAKESENSGQLILDATCAPSDIAYPTDLRLLNKAREKLEEMIDRLHKPDAGTRKKPRTYRLQARKAYLVVEKQRKKHQASLRKAIRKQLGYVKRDLAHVGQYLQEAGREKLLSKRQRQELKTIRVLYAQQKRMYAQKVHSVEERIVSISQPHIRPIVRGKAGAEVEFGCKVMTSVVNGYCFIEKMSFNSFNEGVALKEAVERYRERFGCYPKAVLADILFRNRENLSWLKERAIRISGPKLGRPFKIQDKAQKRLERRDSGLRNAIESSYGVAKRKLGLDLVKAKLEGTAQSSIALQFLVMNLERRLRVLLRLFFKKLFLDYNARKFSWVGA